MREDARVELNDIKWRLRRIIAELYNVADDVKNNTTNIGSDRCSKSIESVARKYEYVVEKLNKIDSSYVADWAKKDTY